MLDLLCNVRFVSVINEHESHSGMQNGERMAVCTYLSTLCFPVIIQWSAFCHVMDSCSNWVQPQYEAPS
jgi:hypothetical protein